MYGVCSKSLRSFRSSSDDDWILDASSFPKDRLLEKAEFPEKSTYSARYSAGRIYEGQVCSPQFACWTVAAGLNLKDG